MRRVLVAWVGCAVGIAPASVGAGGKLGRVRSEVRGSPKPSPSPARSTSPPSTRRVVYTVPTYRAPTAVPGQHPCCSGAPPRPAVDEAPRRRPPKTVPSFARYPYEPGHRFYVSRLTATEAAERDLFAGTAHVEGGYAGDGVWRTGGGLALRAWRIGLEGDLHWLVDPKERDALYLGSGNATFTLVMQPSFLWRLGPGVNFMLDGRTPGEGTREYAAGVNATTSMDIFPAKPVVLSGRFDYGRIWKAETMTVRGTVGWIVQRWELYAGYEYERVGDVPLGGPILGVRAWY